MKCIGLIIFFLSVLTLFVGSYYIMCKTLIEKHSGETSIIQQLIELEIVVSEQSKTIESQAEELEDLKTGRANIVKTALEVAGENYVLHKAIDDMTVSMKQMFEYIQKLEKELRDRDA